MREPPDLPEEKMRDCIQAALAYYRYERIIQDIAAFCEQLLLTGEGGEDRAQSYGYLASNFLPGNTIEVAYSSDKTAQV